MFEFFRELGDAMTFLVLKTLQFSLLIFGICVFIDGVIHNS